LLLAELNVNAIYEIEWLGLGRLVLARLDYALTFHELHFSVIADVGRRGFNGNPGRVLWTWPFSGDEEAKYKRQSAAHQKKRQSGQAAANQDEWQHISALARRGCAERRRPRLTALAAALANG
jgi:hypothetical protein